MDFLPTTISKRQWWFNNTDDFLCKSPAINEIRKFQFLNLDSTFKLAIKIRSNNILDDSLSQSWWIGSKFE